MRAKRRFVALIVSLGNVVDGGHPNSHELEGCMSKAPKSKKPCSLTVPSSPPVVTESDFDVVLALIEAARTRAVTAANTTLIDLYGNIGEYISKSCRRGMGQGNG
jgi:hypothetical protein